jgi:undecaprenyl-diphosphatase
MELWQALVLGVVEGLTEFVPVSSTGHLILVQHYLGLHGPAVNAYAVVIQLGALLAAVYYYRQTLIETAVGLFQRRPAAQRLFANLCLGSLPLLLLGYRYGKRIKAQLFTPGAVAAAILVGGVVMLGLELWYRLRQRRAPGQPTATLSDPAALSPPRALLVGAIHTLALWPGTSRSFASITGGLLTGLSMKAAADFAFLLALPTLGVATVYELYQEGPAISQTLGAAPLALGLIVSFVVGLAVIAGFLRYLQKFGLWAFGCYRIALGALLLWVVG